MLPFSMSFMLLHNYQIDVSVGDLYLEKTTVRLNMCFLFVGRALCYR